MGTSHAFEPPAAGACDQCCQTNTRQTTHHQEVQVSTVVTRKRHPFEGCRLSVIRSLTRRGILDLLVILPDGSRTLIPAAWTDWNDGQEAKAKSSTGGEADVVETLCTISDLLKARAVTDALRFFDASSGFEQVPKRRCDQVDDGRERGDVAVAARTRPGGLEETVEPFETGVAVG